MLELTFWKRRCYNFNIKESMSSDHRKEAAEELVVSSCWHITLLRTPATLESSICQERQEYLI